jgi:hypothetical protein
VAPNGVEILGELEVPKPKATDKPTTARARAPATIQAVVALRRSPAVRRRSERGGSHG